ncbi:invasion associated locus B family protein [Histidinibacterium aquaticum]|nr:invasion associated locus B family protein [Histidinibacterium aquaticum]
MAKLRDFAPRSVSGTPPLALALAWGISGLAGPTTAQTGQPPLPATSEDIGDWKLECFAVTEDGGPCQIYQRVQAGDTNTVALAAAVTILADSSVAVQFALPLGISLQQPPRLRLDEDDELIVLPVSRCIGDGCLIEGTISPEVVDSLTGADEATMLVRIPTGNVIPLPLSLTGFGEGLERLEEVRPEAGEGPDNPATSGLADDAPQDAPDDESSALDDPAADDSESEEAL